MRPSPGDLRAIFGRPPEQVIAYLERKGFAITWNWHDVAAAAHARSFTVAKATSLDILQDIRNALLDDLRNGGTERDFIRKLQPVLEAKGWWGKKEVTHETGVAETVRLGSPRRLRTIYQTNMQSAFMAARQAAMREAIATHPYWMYVNVHDESTRHSHDVMGNFGRGRVFRADDPIWDYIFPPNDYGCRCRVVPLTEEEVKARGLVVESSAGRLHEVLVEMGVDKRTGEVREAQVMEFDTTDQAGRPASFRPAPGFNASPAASHLMDDVLLDKARRTLGDADALNEIRRFLLSPARMDGWRAFVDGSLAAPYRQGQSMAFGVLRPQDLAFLQHQGAQVQSGVVFVPDRLLVGAKATRHLAAGNALTAAEWHALPLRFASPERVLWDTRNRTLLYVFAAEGDVRTKVAVRFARLRYGGQPVDEAATVFKVAVGDIEGGIAGGIYRPV